MPAPSGSRVRIAATAIASALATFVAALALAPALVHAQRLPQNIRIILPLAPGGPTDLTARVLADGMRKDSDTVVVVENRPSANGIVGVTSMKSAPTDGSTLIYVSSGMITIAPHIDRKLPYDPFKDLVPVAGVAYTDIVLVVGAQLPANTLPEFIALAKASPKPLAMGSAGNGNILHAYIELLKDAAKIDLLHVPYKGAAPALADVLAGQTSGMFAGLAIANQYMKAGKVKALGVVGPRRARVAPDVPTLAEQGVPGLDVLPWFALMAPPGVPPATIAAIGAAVQRAMAPEEVRNRLLAAGLVAWTPVGDEFGRAMRDESEMWRKLVAAKNITSD